MSTRHFFSLACGTYDAFADISQRRQPEMTTCPSPVLSCSFTTSIKRAAIRKEGSDLSVGRQDNSNTDLRTSFLSRPRASIFAPLRCPVFHESDKHAQLTTFPPYIFANYLRTKTGRLSSRHPCSVRVPPHPGRLMARAPSKIHLLPAIQARSRQETETCQVSHRLSRPCDALTRNPWPNSFQ